MYDGLREYNKRELESLVDLILARGLAISYEDPACDVWGNSPGELVLNACTDRGTILSALGECDEELITVVSCWTAGDEPPTLGNMLLVYGNSPGELIADYHVNQAIEEIFEAFIAIHSGE
jgi:hypothetical protein